MRVFVNSETSELKEVLMASIGSFRIHKPVNVTQKHFYTFNPPNRNILMHQQNMFVSVLNKHNVIIHWAYPQSESPMQFNVRDIASVIGDKLVVCSMKEELRRNEYKSIENILAKINNEIYYVEQGFIEGGDVILDKEYLYIGISERTNKLGVNWLKNNFGDTFDIIPIYIKSPFLHLDVVFNIVGENIAIIYPNAILQPSMDILSKKYQVLEVNSVEQFNLATNVFSINKETIISDQRNKRVNSILKESGINVIALDYSEISKIGGSFRCGVCPLLRYPNDNLQDI